MLLRLDRILLRVPNLDSAVDWYSNHLGQKLLRKESRTASLELAQGGELILHTDSDLPAEQVWYLVEDVRGLHRDRTRNQLRFLAAPVQSARGWRATARDPFGNVLNLIDRTGASQAIEDARPAGALFPGIETRARIRKAELIAVYQEVNRTADDLPYTPHFESLYQRYVTQHPHPVPTRGEVWRHILTLRKSGQLPRIGEARTPAPEVSAEEKERIRKLLGKDIGRRDRLPYTERFDQIAEQFNALLSRRRQLPPHVLWRLICMVAK